jgi:hypothetical protein
MNIKKPLLAGLLGFGVAFSTGPAKATLISFSDVLDGGRNGTIVTASNPLSWTHDINDSLDIATAIIQTATLSVVLLDPQKGNEQVQLNLDLTGAFALVTNVPNNGVAVSYDHELSGFQITSLLQSDGMLALILSVAPQGAGAPNVTFQSSTLSGIAERVTIAEPAALALIGAGLTGLGLSRRRRSGRSSRFVLRALRGERSA